MSTPITHTYSDGVAVDIFNNSEDPTHNGLRVFYTTDSEGSRTELCRFAGYAIDKCVIATHGDCTTQSDTAAGIEEALVPIREGVSESEQGALVLTNDGPLVLVFKVAGQVRLHLMRSASHGFDTQFIDDFGLQYNSASFNDLFSPSTETSSWCHMFRQGIRSSAMNPPQDAAAHTFLYLGGETCELPSGDAAVAEETPPTTSIPATILSIEEAVRVLRNPELGLVCYRHRGGEVQLMGEGYLLRVATMTGVSMDELITGEPYDEEPPVQGQRKPATDEYRTRPSSFTTSNRLSVKLASSRFPRTLDLFALYILCGTNSGRRLATVSGFATKLHPSGRILAIPKRGFYNFCRAAGVNPRRELPFPASPSSMRLAIRRIIVSAALPSKRSEIEDQFDQFEAALFNLVPALVSRVLSGTPALESAFESAFGITATGLVSSLQTENRGQRHAFRSVRSALLLSDHYRLVTISRFAMRHLSKSELSVSAMRVQELVAMLSEYSHSSRRRRTVAESVALAAGGGVDEDVDDGGDLAEVEEFADV